MLKRESERVAQAVEHVTFNHGVEGSSPSALTKQDQWLKSETAFLICSIIICLHTPCTHGKLAGICAMIVPWILGSVRLGFAICLQEVRSYV